MFPISETGKCSPYRRLENGPLYSIGDWNFASISEIGKCSPPQNSLRKCLADGAEEAPAQFFYFTNHFCKFGTFRAFLANNDISTTPFKKYYFWILYISKPLEVLYFENSAPSRFLLYRVETER